VEGEIEKKEEVTASLVDMEKLNQMFEEKLTAGLKVFAQEQQQQQQQQQLQAQQEQQQAEQQRLANEQAQQDAFGKVVAPYIMPVAQSLKFQVDDTKDYVKFYTENPEAIARREEIEKTFQNVASTGTARPREDVFSWLTGREKLQKDREAAAQAALQASTVNAGVDQRASLSTKNPYDMNKDEMAAFLKGASF
jgi:hypothetical protein